MKTITDYILNNFLEQKISLEHDAALAHLEKFDNILKENEQIEIIYAELLEIFAHDAIEFTLKTMFENMIL